MYLIASCYEHLQFAINQAGKTVLPGLCLVTELHMTFLFCFPAMCGSVVPTDCPKADYKIIGFAVCVLTLSIL